MGIVALEYPPMAVGDDRPFAYSFVGTLDDGDTLTGTPTVAEQTTSDLTITNKAVSSTELTINSAAVPAAMAVQFNVSGQLLATGKYLIKITVTSVAGDTVNRYLRFPVEGP
jgi:hypothetical protein